MRNDLDHYEAYYADKLWNLMPAVYRAEDTDRFDQPGPLRELVERIGAQAAVLRRGIDRLWEDQSIESCDDWVIPYIADLLATRLVDSLDARGQRIDVAKTIHYRRRKGTLAVLEEIAADITGWDVRVVEFFRRLARTRHNLDPAIDRPDESLVKTGQAFAVADGLKTSFSFLLTPIPVEPGTAQIFAAGLLTGADNGRGTVTGAGLAGTIHYASGQVDLNFAAAPLDKTTVAVFYEYRVDGDRSARLAEGLVGAQTNTFIGGWADLRKVNGAALADRELAVATKLAGQPRKAFDEFFHTADVRRGVSQAGWHNIPRLGVFLWRLRSFAVGPTTPVESKQCPGQFTFDPTGRQIPLFATPVRGYGDQWASPAEWQLPTPITRSMLAPALAAIPAYPLYASVDPLDNQLRPNALGVGFQDSQGRFNLIPASRLTADPATPTSADVYIDPPRGRLVTRNSASTAGLQVVYHYGFPSTLGAGPYDRRDGTYTPASTPVPVTGGKGGFAAALVALGAVGAVTLGDCLTYDSVADLVGIAAVTLGAENQTRPLIRLPALAPPNATEWVFTGGGDTAKLTLDGLFVSGGDIVLRGVFDTVSLVCATLDPGNADAASGYAQTADGRDLVPSRLWVEGTVKSLTIDRSVLGPIRTRGQGVIETLTANDSIVQAVGVAYSQALGGGDGTATSFSASLAHPPLRPGLVKILLAGAQAGADHGDGMLTGAGLAGTVDYASGAVSVAFTTAPAVGATVVAVYEDHPWAIEMAVGLAKLSRCTVLGPASLHRLEASECLLDDSATVINTQDGCVRFSAYASGSVLPRQYESVAVAPRAPLFTSRDFGQPAYAQLLASADSAIVGGPPQATILQGAVDGSEMGAYARDKNPVKVRAILIKYQEYMPLGLVPVIIEAT